MELDTSSRDSAEIGDREGAWSALICRIAAGDQAAMAELFDGTSGFVYALILRILKDPEDAAEVAHDVYVQVWRTAPRFDPSRGKPSTWILTVARTRAIDRLRAGRSRGRGLQEELDVAAHLPSPDPAPDADWETRERRDRVRRAMADLPSEQRDVLLVAYWEGLSQSEIAERLGLPLGTVKTRARLGMIKLRDALEARGATGRT